HADALIGGDEVPDGLGGAEDVRRPSAVVGAEVAFPGPKRVLAQSIEGDRSQERTPRAPVLLPSLLDRAIRLEDWPWVVARSADVAVGQLPGAAQRTWG